MASAGRTLQIIIVLLTHRQNEINIRLRLNSQINISLTGESGVLIVQSQRGSISNKRPGDMETIKKPKQEESAMVFIHGLESSGQGAKGAFFRTRYPSMIIEDFTGPFGSRMAKLETLLAGKDNLTLIGSSYGGLMAAVFACQNHSKIARLILLAPALNHMPKEICRDLQLDFPVAIYHGDRDEVVPPGPVHDLARKIFSNLAYHLVQDDHSLHETFFMTPWDDLLA